LRSRGSVKDLSRQCVKDVMELNTSPLGTGDQKSTRLAIHPRTVFQSKY
jgi:hypothetical protein